MLLRLKEIKEELRQRMHQPVLEQGGWLRQVVTGFLNYHAVPTDSRALMSFRYHVTDLGAAHASAAQSTATSSHSLGWPGWRGTGPRTKEPSSVAERALRR
jgi:hypothetical protein